MISVEKLVILAALCAAVVSAAPAARADEPPRAAELKKRGDEAMDALKYADALALYEQAYAATKDPAILYNMGRAHEALTQYPKALEDLTAFERQAPPALRARVPGLARRIADVRAHVSVLVVRVSVEGARVVLNKKEIGITPLPGPVKTNAGHAVLEIAAEGYRPFQRELDLEGGRETTIDATLLAKSTSGLLVVESPVVGANVELDGKPAGKVPLEVVVQAGPHPLTVSKAGYETSKTSVVIAVDERKRVSIPLEKTTPIVGRWWFWTGVGVVLVAGAFTTYALLTERDAESGTYPPGQVSGPLVSF